MCFKEIASVCILMQQLNKSNLPKYGRNDKWKETNLHSAKLIDWHFDGLEELLYSDSLCVVSAARAFSKTHFFTKICYKNC